MVFGKIMMIRNSVHMRLSAGFYFFHCQKSKSKSLVGSNAAHKAAPSSHNSRLGSSS